MVFESVVTELMNRYLGDFIENLDTKQLNIGIWGGDVVLKNLQLKQSALKELDLPVQTIYGCLGKLVLKIPWKNLYSLPVVADVEDLYLLVAPNAAVPYNAEKQRALDWESKKGELLKFDEAKKRELEKDKPQADKSFTEKLVAQIINNVQIHIKNVHIRYEDRSTSSIPFSIGITLGMLEVHTTNADWEKAFLSEALSKVFKVAKMDGLAIYMNCNSNLFQKSSTSEYTDLFMKTIATKDVVPENFTYVLGPINSIAKLKLNMEPQRDNFKSPKIDLFLEMEKLAVGITKAQYQNLIGLADGMSAMSRGLPYRQYRPYNTPYHNNAKIWWHFAYESILETEVRRRKKSWSWSHMLDHIQLCKDYAAAYRAKISVKTPTTTQIQHCEDLEKKLDLYNILMIRKRVDLEVKISDKQKAEAPKPTSWLRSWFGSNKEDDTKKNESDDILHQFKTAMTPAEKAKLFEAIGYTEGVTDTVLPLEYVAISMEFKLNLLEVCVRNESLVADPKSSSTFNNQTVLSLQVQGVKCGVDQRPASNGLRVDLNLKEFTVYGYKQEDHLPVLVKSKIGEMVDVSLLTVQFEMNPLDKLCDQRVNVSARPLEIAYDAGTIIQLVQTFKMPNNTNLSELTDAAADKISNIKERSATGIQYMVEKHTRLEVKISVMPNYVLIPFGGKYIPDKVQVMVISLGRISLTSVPRDDRKDISEMHSLQFTSEDIMKEVMDQAYDKFRLDIADIQILLAKPTDDWKEILLSGRVTSMHILEPIAMNVCADLCVVDDDPRLPKTRITSKFPHIRLSVTEDNVLDALALITSIPFPENEDTKPMALNKDTGFVASSKSLIRYLDEKQSKKPKKPEVKNTDLSQEIIQYTDLEFSFVMNELSVNIYKSNKRDVDSTPTSQYRTPTEEFQDDQSMSVASQRCSVMESVLNESNQELKLSFQIKQLEMGLVQRTYDMKVSLKLGAIVMDEYQHVAGVERIIRMIETPCYGDLSGYLFSLQFTSANKASPEFTTKYKSIEQLVEINFAVLILRLHQEGLTELLQIANNFQTKLDKILNAPGKDRIASAGNPVSKGLATIAEEPTAVPTSLKALRNETTRVDSIKVQLVAKMERVAIRLENERRAIADLKIDNLTTRVVMKTSYTEVSVTLQDIVIDDMNPETIHPTIVSVIGGNAITCTIVLYNLHETFVYNSDDMNIDVSMGCVKIIFLNWFVNSVLSFLDNFQAAQQAIADASAAAAVTAKQNMVDAYANATRMKLNIKIKAPIIIVPVDSKSLEAISIDLGSLSITNNCSEISGSSTTDSGAAILDEMKLELTEMKISKIVVVNGDTSQRTPDMESDSIYGIRKINDHANMLDPTSFVLIIKRNLSSSWYKKEPEMDISGRLKSIILNLMESDYKMLMMILSKNMSEGSDERTAIVQPVTPEKTPSNSASSNTNAPLHAIEAEIAGRDGETSAWDAISKKAAETKPFGLDIASLKPGSPTQAVNTFLKFAFQMDSIILNLFTDRNEGLATFGIHFLSVKGHKLVDESLNASIVLCDVQLDDTRPDRQNNITRYMKKRELAAHSHDDSSKPDPSMVDIVVRITQNEMFVNLKVSSFDLILCLEYLMKILQFVSVPEDESAPKPVQSSQVTAAPTTTTTTVSKKPVDAPATPSKQMTVLLRVEQPDIILVEKMDDINCLALILNTQIELRLRIQDDTQNIKGDISDLKFYICEFNPARREATKHFILQPCQISLHGNTPEAKGMNISLTTSDIRVNISPAIIELLNKTLTTLTGSEAKDDVTLEELTDYSDLWDVKTYKDTDYWFMKVDSGEDVLKTLDKIEVKEHLPEVCIVEVPSIVLVIETGLGYYTYPMLVIETKMNAHVKDWSSEISIESSMTLGMAYYNSSMAVWEPIIEPNEHEKSNGLSVYGPWELNFNLKIEKNLDDSTGQVEPKTKILVSSSDTLEMSVTKTCLDVLQDLGNAFSQAIRPEGLHKPDIVAPYIVENDTGFDITLNLKRGAFFLHNSHLPTAAGNDAIVRSGVVFKSLTNSGTELSPEEVTTCKISPGARAYLQGKKEDSMDVISAFSSLNKDSQNDMFLHVQIGDIDKEVTLPIHKADRRYFPLYRDTKQEPWGILSHVKTEYGSKVITISGVLKIQNHFSTTISVFRMRDGVFHDIGQVAPGACYNVPLHALYAVHKELYFSIAGYKTSVQGINWKDCPSDFKYTKYLQCDPTETFEPFYITAIREREDVYHEVTSKVTMLSACYVIHLKPPLYLRNALPIDISISVAGCSVANTDDASEAKEVSVVDGSPIKKNFGLELSPRDDFLDYGEKVVKPGDVLHLPTVKTTAKEGVNKSYIVARLIQYLEKDWSCTTEIPSVPPEFAVWTFCSYDSVDKMTLALGVKFENRHGSLQLTVYCPYWMINKTGLLLSYRKSRKTEKHELSGSPAKASNENVNVLYHPPEWEGPILFSFREKVFFGKKRASVRVESGEWSDRFALDAAGSTGVVECKSNDMVYEIAVHNTLTHNSLTKQIMFIPMYVMMNKAPFTIEVQEDRRPGDPWIEVPHDQCVPLWPRNDTCKLLRVKSKDDMNLSSPFRFNEVQCSLLKFNNKYGGINVDVQVTEGGVYITFMQYHAGDAPALIINNTNQRISFWEKGNVNERSLNPSEKVLYTWSDPAGDRILLWNDGDKHVENDLRRDGVATSQIGPDEICFWASFLDGTQRVLLFTNDEFIARETQSVQQLEKVTQEIEVDIRGIGLSLVNNLKQCDIMYIGIASSGVIWEEKKKNKYFKQMKIQEVDIMETKYKEYLRDQQVGSTECKKFYLDAANKIQIDFDAMKLYKSNPREVKRLFYPGLWIKMNSSPYQKQIHAKINRIQIDNQLTDCIFPVVLAPVPPPKSVAATTELKPFVECSIVERIIPHSDVKQFKYLTMLIQEFHVKVDLLFINEIVEMVSTELTDEESRQKFAEDIKRQEEPLSALVLTQSSQEQKNFYDQLHLGPLKIHISFSMAGLEPGALPGVLSTILQGVGVTLTDINDIVFRLSFFDRQYTFFTQRQLTSEIVSHYAGQAVKQAYVLILGLDVIGNPYGLVVGLTKGVEDLFYEPFQGAVQGPQEFAEGLVLGVKSLFGHTVGGAAGAVSKITGAMGKGLAALTFDKEYQKKRREQLNKKPANLQEGIARSGKGLVMGVVDGVTGVFTKPISGAKADGVEGFFKGLGQGAVGLIARPTTGFVDFASGSFDAVKRAAEMSEDVNRLRAPRFLHSDGILRPFCVREAEGNKLLKEIEKGKYANSDTFAHYEVIIEKRDVLLLSDHRILYCVKNDIFGGWQVEWTYSWTEIASIKATERGVQIVIGEKTKKLFGVFGSSDQLKKLILIQQRAKRDNLTTIMEALKQKSALSDK